MSEKKNLLIIVQHLCRGGAEKSAAKMSIDLSLNFNVYLVTLFSDKEWETTFKYGGKLLQLNQSSKASALLRIFYFFKRIYLVNQIKKKYKIDVSLSFMQNADLINVLSRRKEKVILSIRTAKNLVNTSKISQYLFRKLYDKANNIILQNNDAYKLFKTEYAINDNKLKVIPNYYNIDAIRAYANDELDVADFFKNEIVFGHVSRLYPVKGQLFLLRVFKKLLEKFPEAKLLIIGEGEYRNELLKYAQSLELAVIGEEEFKTKQFNVKATNVFFTGFDKNPYKYFKIMDVFLFTSLTEGFPNALAEAMICGVPVISSDCKTGPMFLLNPEGLNYEHYPMISDFGCLMPVFTQEYVAPNSSLSDEETIWVDTVTMIMNDSLKRASMAEKAMLRMEEFRKENVLDMWLKLLTN